MTFWILLGIGTWCFIDLVLYLAFVYPKWRVEMLVSNTLGVQWWENAIKSVILQDIKTGSKNMVLSTPEGKKLMGQGALDYLSEFNGSSPKYDNLKNPLNPFRFRYLRKWNPGFILFGPLIAVIGLVTIVFFMVVMILASLRWAILAVWYLIVEKKFIGL